MKLFATLGLSSILLAAPAFAAPFGVDFTSATPEALGCTALKREGRYSCETMPDQSWSLRDYDVTYSEARGICTIAGSSALLQSGPDGAEIRAAMEKLKDQIAQTYGQPELHDGAFSGEPLPDDKSWMAQVGEMDRQYYYTWTFDPPRDGISDIALIASSDGAASGAYQLQVNAPGAFECFMGK